MQYLRGLGVPLLVLGGGGYTLRNVPRCWAYETAVIGGIAPPDEIPEAAEYRYYYGPRYTLSVHASNADDLNTPRTVDAILESVTETFRAYVYPVAADPSVSNERSQPSDPLALDFVTTLAGEEDNTENHTVEASDV